MMLTYRWQIIFAKLGIIILSIYFLVRITYLFLSGFSPLHLIYAITFFISELFLLITAFGFFMTIVNIAKSRLNEEKTRHAIVPINYLHYPPVAVIVPARHEPRDILETTFTTLKGLNYPNKTLYFLDDSTDEKFKREAELIASKYSAELFRREERHGPKAGIINDFLKTHDEKYLAVFDADQNPMPNFLQETI
jgi:cellulose synthase (UDP-forming)